MRHILTSVGEKLSREEMSELVKLADPENLGRIHFDDFIKIMLAK